MNLRSAGALVAVFAVFFLSGCNGGDTSVSRSPSAEEIKQSQQNAIKSADADNHMSEQQKAAIKEHLGGVPAAEANARSADLHKK